MVSKGNKGKAPATPSSSGRRISTVAARHNGSAGQAAGQGVVPPLAPARASYEAVVACQRLFMMTLVQLHDLLGTKMRVPTIGGKPLNLHQLFVQVTTRGGIEKVLKDRKWKEVIATFNFPSTITSASFVMKKYYYSLLFHYERIYFFRMAIFNPSSHARQPPPSHVAGPSHARGMPAPQMVPMALPGYITQGVPVVTGRITGKFDLGYVVTANIGPERLAGVLYHVPLGIPVQNLPFLNPVQFVPEGFRRANNVAEDFSEESYEGSSTSQTGEVNSRSKTTVSMDQAKANEEYHVLPDKEGEEK